LNSGAVFTTFSIKKMFHENAIDPSVTCHPAESHSSLPFTSPHQTVISYQHGDNFIASSTKKEDTST
jgi:hypothetical protein